MEKKDKKLVPKQMSLFTTKNDDPYEPKGEEIKKYLEIEIESPVKDLNLKCNEKNGIYYVALYSKNLHLTTLTIKPNYKEKKGRGIYPGRIELKIKSEHETLDQLNITDKIVKKLSVNITKKLREEIEIRTKAWVMSKKTEKDYPICIYILKKKAEKEAKNKELIKKYQENLRLERKSNPQTFS